MTLSHRQRRRGDDTARKAMLYCPDCGHESPIDGDWRVGQEKTGEDVTFRCPACGTVVTTRPNRGLALA